MSLVDRSRACARFDARRYRPFRVGGVAVGRMTAEVADVLRPFGDVFRISETDVELAAGLNSPEDRTEAIAGVLAVLRDDGRVPGWRDEAYPVAAAFAAPALFTMERAAVPLFGVKGYGVHVNGFVDDGKEIGMWIGRRSRGKPTGPGKLDQVVAGGQPAGISVIDNMVKECAEEAGIGEDLARTAAPVGTVSYLTERPEGLRDDVLFDFDLRLPPEFEPVNEDGEVEDFYLWPIAKVIETLEETDDFKFNSALVVIDFLVRRGHIGPGDPDYAEIAEGLHRGRAVSIG